MKRKCLAFQFVLLGIAILCFNCSDKVEHPQLIAYTSSECQDDLYFKNLRRVNNRIMELHSTEAFQEYNIYVVTNCDRTTKGAIEFKNDTLHLIHHGERTYHTETIQRSDSITEVTEVMIEELTDCDCAYELNYKISGLKSDRYPVTLNGKTLTKSDHKYKVVYENPKFKIVENDTINFIDIYGLKQGLHKSYRRDGKLLWAINYTDGEPISGITKIRYNTDGYDRIEMHMEHKKHTKRNYYKQEKLVKSCDTEGFFDDDTNCENLD